MARVYCPDCHRSFVDDNALYQHRKFRHGAPFYRKRRAPVRDDYDESIADIAIGAELKALTGEPLDEFEASLVP